MTDTNLMSRQELEALVRQYEGTISHQTKVIDDMSATIAVMKKNRLVPTRERPQRVFPPMAAPESIQEPPQAIEDPSTGEPEYEPESESIVEVFVDTMHNDELADDADLAAILAGISMPQMAPAAQAGDSEFTFAAVLDGQDEEPDDSGPRVMEVGGYEICNNNRAYFEKCCQDYPGLYMPIETPWERFKGVLGRIRDTIISGPDYDDEEAG